MKHRLLAVAVATALFAAPWAAATTPPQRHPSLTQLAAKISALETNAAKLRAEAAEALAAAHAAQAELAKMQADQREAKRAARLAAVSNPTPPRQASGIGIGNAYNPSIAVILNGFYTHHSLDPSQIERSGFPRVGEGEPLPQGISLGESEMTLAANIDDKFYGQMTVTAETENGEDHLGVEEAYIDTTALPAGFGVRAGRFYSAIGYLNSHHAHTDFFSDRPLAYQALLGNQFGDDGVQVTWVAPTNTFVQLGGEVFRGDHYPASGAGRHGAGAHTAFVHLGGDVGVHNAWYAGVSVLDARASHGEDGFSGSDKLTIADGTWKWSRHGNFKEGGFMFRGEYLVDRRRGNYDPASASDPGAAADPAIAALPQQWIGTRRGAYIEGVYQLNRRWNFGYRYDKLWSDDDGPYASAFDPSRHSVMVAWHNSEFSLLRLQLSHEKPMPQRSDTALILQYQVALGAHGAHKF